jgi:tetratricopeptide (TPR) repeat protein
VAVSLNNLARLYYLQGEYAEAEPLLSRSLAITENAYGPNHPNLGATLSILAEVDRNQGKYSEAEPLYKQAIAIAENIPGQDRPHW